MDWSKWCLTPGTRRRSSRPRIGLMESKLVSIKSKYLTTLSEKCSQLKIWKLNSITSNYAFKRMCTIQSLPTTIFCWKRRWSRVSHWTTWTRLHRTKHYWCRKKDRPSATNRSSLCAPLSTMRRTSTSCARLPKASTIWEIWMSCVFKPLAPQLPLPVRPASRQATSRAQSITSSSSSKSKTNFSSCHPIKWSFLRHS